MVMKFVNLQVLRGFSAISVVLFHLNVYSLVYPQHLLNCNLYSMFGNIFSSTVFIFFGISGFLMATLIDTEYKNFLLMRLVRIYPTFWIAAMLTIIIKVIIFSLTPQPNLFTSLTLLPAGNINYPLFIEWTLIYEIFFYIVCSFFTFNLTRKYYTYFLIAWSVIIVIALFIGINTMQRTTIEQIFFAYFNLFFIAGSITYYVIKHNFITTNKYLLALFSLIGISSIILFYSLSMHGIVGQIIKTIIFSIGIGMIIYSFVLIDRVVDTSSRLIQFFEHFGNYSYGLYLIHVPAITIFFSVWVNILKLPFDPTIVGSLVLALTLIIGWYYGKLDVWIHEMLKLKIRTSLKDKTTRTALYHYINEYKLF
jgi:exopolysaccharide production protein ExoZ